MNVATGVTSDTGTTTSDSGTILVEVPCDTRSTLTPGYWKTHSKYGPAPYDATWALWSGDEAFTVEYEVLPPYHWVETHVYAGKDKFPQVPRGRRTVGTVAPGQYDTAAGLGGRIYVVFHAVAAIPDPEFGP